MSRIHFFEKNTTFCPFKQMGAQIPKNPPNSPFILGHVNPYLIHEFLGRPHSLRQTTARSVHGLLHNYAINSPLVTMGRPEFTPSNTAIPRPTPFTIPNGIQIHSAILPHYTFRRDRHRHTQTHTQTDRWSMRQVRNMSAYAQRATR